MIAAFFLRIIGIQYALPFRISLDESSLVYGTLKMMELHTLIPSLHSDIFNNLLSYPPYIPYIYIPFFLFGAVIKFLQFLFMGGGVTDAETFKLLLASDPSIFFVIARAISALFGLATVYAVYKISKNIFKNEKLALFSAAFLAFSFLHVSFSHAARHWIYVTLFFSLVMYALSRFDYSVQKRYTMAFVLLGLGMGVNYQVGIGVFFITLWFLCFERLSIVEHFQKAWAYKALGLYFILSIFAIALFPHTTGLMDQTLGRDWGLLGLLKTYNFYMSQMWSVEFIFLLFVAIGLIVSFFRNRGYFWISSGFPLIYIAFFYFVYHTHDNGRYLLMLYPVFAITAGYGFYYFHEKLLLLMPKLFVYGLTFSIFFFMLFVSLKLDYLLAKADTRVQASEWINAELPADARLITFAPFMKLPATSEALQEQGSIDPSSVSRIDIAGSLVPQKFSAFPKHYSVNLYGIKNIAVISDIKNYIKMNDFDYLIYAEDLVLLENKGLMELLDVKGENIKVIKGFSGTDGDINNDFVGGLKYILNSDNNGPTMIIKKISKTVIN
ncbi:MAG: glycosyltransferase family 39 protein [Candidatus Magasanikbacteria bacterium]|nr:glycosyltransferase family 39 protein [Candidatus Magasanikbacteria bacterium]